jgi:luciferase family oxidoreductase group 1
VPGSTGIALSVLDQSPMREGGTAAEALRETVELAVIAEGLGYRRYWLAEHHSATSFAGTSPELVIPQAAVRTQTIRLGSGGVLLHNTSALRVAERFRVLEAFHPGRIDLGIGRARGGEPVVAAALSHPRPLTEAGAFPAMVDDLLAFLHGTVESGHAAARVRAQPGPVPATLPSVWLLGSGVSTAQVAAARGLPFAFAEFLEGGPEMGPQAVAAYRGSFQPSPLLAAPRFVLAVEAICAPTEREARELAASRNFDRVAAAYGIQGLLHPEDAAAAELTGELRELVERAARCCTVGDPGQVRDRILAAARRYRAEEVLILTNCYAFADRERSYALIAEAFA